MKTLYILYLALVAWGAYIVINDIHSLEVKQQAFLNQLSDSDVKDYVDAHRSR